MAGTAVRDGAANLARAHAVADVTRTVSVETQRPSITVPPDLRPAQATVGQARDHPTESPDAAGGVLDDRAHLQSAVESAETHDGQQDLCRGHVSEAPVSDPACATEVETSRATPNAAQSGLGL